MNPNLQYAQAIFGVNKGRGIGIIDTLQLVEVARAATLLDKRQHPARRRRDSTLVCRLSGVDAHLEERTGGAGCQ